MSILGLHRHRWEKESETFSSPPSGVEAKWIDADTMLKLAYGVTTVTQRCSECGERRAFTVAGRTAAAT